MTCWLLVGFTWCELCILICINKLRCENCDYKRQWNKYHFTDHQTHFVFFSKCYWEMLMALCGQLFSSSAPEVKRQAPSVAAGSPRPGREPLFIAGEFSFWEPPQSPPPVFGKGPHWLQQPSVCSSLPLPSVSFLSEAEEVLLHPEVSEMFSLCLVPQVFFLSGAFATAPGSQNEKFVLFCCFLLWAHLNLTSSMISTVFLTLPSASSVFLSWAAGWGLSGLRTHLVLCAWSPSCRC